jgi:uncharacterized protein
MHTSTFKRPVTSEVGIGLRKPHYRALSENNPDIQFLEVHSENYFGFGPEVDLLQAIGKQYPISLHGVGLSLGSAEGIQSAHLESLKRLVDLINPLFVSDHASWSLTGNAHLNDLLPLPYNEESLKVICDNVAQTQDFLGRQILLENPSTYMAFKDDMPEYEFMLQVAEKTKCKILLDVNNIYVNSKNYNFDPYNYIKQFTANIIGEIHLAGHSVNNIDGQEIRIDTHDNLVVSDVWDLYKFTMQTLGIIPTLIEWDQNIPELEVLLGETKKAARIQTESLQKYAA